MFKNRENEHAAECGTEKLNNVNERPGRRASIIKAVAAGTAAVMITAVMFGSAEHAREKNASGLCGVLTGVCTGASVDRLARMEAASEDLSERVEAASGDRAARGVISAEVFPAIGTENEELNASGSQTSHSVKGAGVEAKNSEIPQGVQIEDGEALPELIDIRLNRISARLDAYEEEQQRLEAAADRKVEQNKRHQEHDDIALGQPRKAGLTDDTGKRFANYVHDLFPPRKILIERLTPL